MKIEVEVDMSELIGNLTETLDPALFQRIMNLTKDKPIHVVMPILLTAMTKKLVASAHGDEGLLAQGLVLATTTLMRSARMMQEFEAAEAMSEKEGQSTQ